MEPFHFANEENRFRCINIRDSNFEFFSSARLFKTTRNAGDVLKLCLKADNWKTFSWRIALASLTKFLC